MSGVRVLNKLGGANIPEERGEQNDVSARLQILMLEIKGEFMSEEGKVVDYSALRNSELFTKYIQESSKLSSVNLDALADEERMAFFINIYNALTIHGICEQGVPTSVLGVKSFWKSTAYNIGGHIFTLDDIEHGILRGNRPHPSSPSPLFSESDPRLHFSIPYLDPRIHFALVCGAKSCPAINVYSARNLQRGLKAATENFCSQEVQVDLRINQVKLSKIFLWYKSDFGKSDMELLRWTLPYLPDKASSELKELLKESEKGQTEVSVCYSDYNWNLNSIVANL